MLNYDCHYIYCTNRCAVCLTGICEMSKFYKYNSLLINFTTKKKKKKSNLHRSGVHRLNTFIK